MLNARLSTPNSNYSISRPVARSILNSMLLRFNLPENTHIEIHDNIRDYKNRQWNLAEGDSESDIRHERYIESTYRESFTGDIMTANYRNNDTKPVIHDPDTGMYIQPYMMPAKLDVAFTIRDKSETELNRISNYLRELTIQNMTVQYHTVQYSYYLPKFFKEVLVELHSAHDYQLDSETDLLKWLETFADDRATTVTNQGRTLKSLDIAFKETQNRVVGMFEEEIHNVQHQYDKDSGYYEMELTYTIYYDKVTHLDMWYPPIAYNIPLSADIVDRYLTNDSMLDGNASEDIANSMTFGSSAEYKEIYERLKDNEGYLRIPEFDYHTDMVRVQPVTVDFHWPSVTNDLIPNGGWQNNGVANAPVIIPIHSTVNDMTVNNQRQNRILGTEMSTVAATGYDQRGAFLNTAGTVRSVGTVPSQVLRTIGDDVRLPIFSIAVTITRDNLISLFNLDKLGDVHLTPAVLDAIKKGDYKWITKFLESIFSIEIYENGRKMPGNPIAIDGDLNVTATQPLNIKRSYRVLFSVLPNLNLLSNAAFNRLNTDDNLKGLLGHVLGDYTHTFNVYEMFNIENGEKVVREVNGNKITISTIATRYYRARLITHVISKHKGDA